MKKEVDFAPHTPPKVKSKNVAGPPVYYPPGAAEFTKKEEASAAMSQSGGGVSTLCALRKVFQSFPKLFPKINISYSSV